MGMVSVPDAALKHLRLLNNCFVTERGDNRELQHCYASYLMQLHRDAEYFEGLKDLMPQARRRSLELERQRMPLAVEIPPELGDRGPISPEGMWVLLRLLREEERRRTFSHAAIGASARLVSNSFYSEGCGEEIDNLRCVMCQKELLPLWQAYREARQEFLRRKAILALGPKYHPPGESDFSFFLHGGCDLETATGAVPSEDAARYAPWERDLELLWMIGESITSGRYNGDAVCCSTALPLCFSRFLDVATERHVPQFSFVCGDALCESQAVELAADGAAAGNYHRVDYSKVDPDTDDEESLLFGA